jgi:hypothetical protein
LLKNAYLVKDLAETPLVGWVDGPVRTNTLF